MFVSIFSEINSFSSENCRDEIVCDDSVNLVEDEDINKILSSVRI